MRNGLNETLARMARREEALRRRAGDPGDDPGRSPSPAASAAAGRGGRPAGPGPGELTGDGRPGPDRDPVRDAVEAVRRVVDAHPGLSVTLRVEYEGRTFPLRVEWTGSGATVGPDHPAPPPPAWPVSGRRVPAWAPATDGLTDDSAARLAEMIRHDPSLLTGDR
ncbi:hypothetical protein E1193_23315 [Micromonospora sp. KC606]|uniref:hypothetical protein n=1 Tax=Micromonospora sp. KC606 TaxID=2530379 RepID=UPI0010510DD3|nr:hypothetical protein [Micromonospora sp. KC606]TDC76793.1 hypothetical protein E1193_23315 [Micromonospora sp. KC606]